jgi:signal transduction histidine kinase
MFPDAAVPRPYDLGLAALYLVVALPLFRVLDKADATQFSHALTVSILPQIATQLHMAFGSRALYDGDFNIAHFLKIVAYCVPLSGLLLDYIRTYRSQSLMAQLSAANGRLETRKAELRVVNHRLEEEILERGRAAHVLEITARELVSARDAAVKASRAKSEFIANMSHELRTPLNAILGFGQLLHLEMADRGIPYWDGEVGKIERAATRLLLLINDILDLSKIEAGKMELYRETFDIAAVVSDVVSEIEPMAAKNRNELRAVVEPAVLYTDRARVQQCLLNLVGNASKFTHGGRVVVEGCLARHLTTDSNGAWYVLRVTDNGIGIPADEIGRLFADFSQLDATATRKYGGTGLGLSISRNLCRLMGGDITVESISGEGSAFTMRIPAGDRSEANVPILLKKVA